MKIILLTQVGKLGNLGDIVNVRSGYGRYLIRFEKALIASPGNLEHFEKIKAELTKEAKAKLEQAQHIAQKISDLETIVISAKAGNEGKLFGSIGPREIADEINKIGVDLKSSNVILKERIRQTGDSSISIKVHQDVVTSINLSVVAN